MADSAIINGYQTDHGTTTIKIGEKTYDGLVKELKYSSKREIGKLRGTSPLARGRTRGIVDFEGSMVLWKYGFDMLVADLGDGWMEAQFDIIVSYGDDDQPITVDTLVSCTILSDEGGTSEGADPHEVSLSLDIKVIKRNGKIPMKGIKA